MKSFPERDSFEVLKSTPPNNSTLKKKLSIINKLRRINSENFDDIVNILKSEDLHKFHIEIVNSLLSNGNIHRHEDIQKIVRVVYLYSYDPMFVGCILGQLKERVKESWVNYVIWAEVEYLIEKKLSESIENILNARKEHLLQIANYMVLNFPGIKLSLIKNAVSNLGDDIIRNSTEIYNNLCVELDIEGKTVVNDRYVEVIKSDNNEFGFYKLDGINLATPSSCLCKRKINCENVLFYLKNDNIQSTPYETICEYNLSRFNADIFKDACNNCKKANNKAFKYFNNDHKNEKNDQKNEKNDQKNDHSNEKNDHKNKETVNMKYNNIKNNYNNEKNNYNNEKNIYNNEKNIYNNEKNIYNNEKNDHKNYNNDHKNEKNDHKNYNNDHKNYNNDHKNYNNIIYINSDNNDNENINILESNINIDCSSKEDKACEFLKNINGKVESNNDLIEALVKKRTKSELVPYLARIVALMTHGQREVVMRLMKNDISTIGKNDLTFIGELYKFGVVKLEMIVEILEKYLKTRDITRFCILFDNIGRFILVSREGNKDGRRFIEEIKKFRCDETEKTLIEGCLARIFNQNRPTISVLDFLQWFFKEHNFIDGKLFEKMLRNKAFMVTCFFQPELFENDSFMAGVIKRAGMEDLMAKFYVENFGVILNNSKQKIYALVRVLAHLIAFKKNQEEILLKFLYNKEIPSDLRHKLLLELLDRCRKNVKKKYLNLIIKDSLTEEVKIDIFNFCEKHNLPCFIDNIADEDSFDLDIKSLCI